VAEERIDVTHLPSEVITESECPGGLRLESTIFSGAGHGVGIMMKHRTWNWIRSEIFTIYRNRIQSHRREKDFVNFTISTPHAKF